MPNLAVIVGTRPEAIKLAPLILELRKRSMPGLVISTGQHETICTEALRYFGIAEDVRLSVMRANQPLALLQGRLLAALSEEFLRAKPCGVIVQGDTMSAFSGALAAFYQHIPVFHVEAGLRTYDLGEPFPEEAFRQMLSRIASLHFAPTDAAKDALRAEGIPDSCISVTGNTIVDALSCITHPALARAKETLGDILSHPLVLVTVHRRENHGPRLRNILSAVRLLSDQYPSFFFLLPVHPNPNVRSCVHEMLSDLNNVLLTEPLEYPEMVLVMQKALLALSDSGGIQEEAPSFGLPLLVLRHETERKEGIRLGCAKLVGTDTETIVEEARKVLERPRSHECLPNPYGDGKASSRIATILEDYFDQLP